MRFEIIRWTVLFNLFFAVRHQLHSYILVNHQLPDSWLMGSALPRSPYSLSSWVDSPGWHKEHIETRRPGIGEASVPSRCSFISLFVRFEDRNPLQLCEALTVLRCPGECVGWGENWLCVMPARNRGRGFVLFGKHLKGLWALANLHCSCVFRQQNERGRTERGKRAELRIRTGSLSRAQASLAESVVANGGAGRNRIQA